MSDLIDRQKALEKIYQLPIIDKDAYEFYRDVRKSIKSMPSAEPKKGRWIWDENGMDWNIGAWTCSACGSKAETFWQTYKESNPHRCAGSHYCSNCGAKMEVDK